MSTSIDAGGLTSPPDAPTGTARAHEAVTDTPKAITTYVAVIGSQTDWNDPASVNHGCSEADRQAFLRRAQTVTHRPNGQPTNEAG